MFKKVIGLAPEQYVLLVKMYVVWLIVFSAFRMLMLFLNVESLTENGADVLFEAFRWGFTFDNIIISYAMILPFLLLSISLISIHIAPVFVKIIRVYYWVFGVVFTLFLVFDLPYFSYYSARLNPAILSWFKTPGTSLSAVVGDFRYYPFFALGVALIYGSWYVFFKTNILSIKQFMRAKFVPSLLCFLIVGTLVFRGMRGPLILIDPLLILEILFTVKRRLIIF